MDTDFGELTKLINGGVALGTAVIVKAVIIPLLKKWYGELSGVATVKAATVTGFGLAAVIVIITSGDLSPVGFLTGGLTGIVAGALATGIDVAHNATGLLGGDKDKV